MIEFIYDREQLPRMIAEGIAGAASPGWTGTTLNLAVAIGVVKDGTLIGGVSYTPMDHRQAEISAYFSHPGWATRGVLQRLFHYPFEEAGWERLTSRVSVNNARSLKVTEGIGLKREGLMRQGWFDGSDAVIFGMLRDECKWLRGLNNGK